MTDENNVLPHKAYLKSLGKKMKDLTPAELKVWRSHYNKYRYDSIYKDRYDSESACQRARDRYNSGGREHAAEYRRRRYSGSSKVVLWFHSIRDRTNATGSFEDIVGCTKEMFIEHIESLFTNGMSWDNWGKGKGKTVWHIDHVTAVKSGGSSHYTNLQPLWCIDNIRKGSS